MFYKVPYTPCMVPLSCPFIIPKATGLLKDQPQVSKVALLCFGIYVNNPLNTSNINCREHPLYKAHFALNVVKR